VAFNIRFLPEVLPGSTVGDTGLIGEILLGEELEGFQSFIGFWSPLDYKLQWLQGVRRLVRERLNSCLIASVDDPAFGEVVFWWLLYPDGDVAHVREGLLLPEDQAGRFSTSDPYSCIPPRGDSEHDGVVISEWDVPISDFAHFLDATDR
jgi:CdiI N-terminal domain